MYYGENWDSAVPQTNVEINTDLVSIEFVSILKDIPLSPKFKAILENEKNKLIRNKISALKSEIYSKFEKYWAGEIQLPLGIEIQKGFNIDVWHQSKNSKRTYSSSFRPEDWKVGNGKKLEIKIQINEDFEKNLLLQNNKELLKATYQKIGSFLFSLKKYDYNKREYIRVVFSDFTQEEIEIFFSMIRYTKKNNPVILRKDGRYTTFPMKNGLGDLLKKKREEAES